MTRSTPSWASSGGSQQGGVAFTQVLDAIAPHATVTVQAVISGAARARGTLGMRFDPMRAEIAAALPGPLAHREVAQALRPALGPLLHEKGPAPRAGPSSNP